MNMYVQFRYIMNQKVKKKRNELIVKYFEKASNGYR